LTGGVQSSNPFILWLDVR